MGAIAETLVKITLLLDEHPAREQAQAMAFLATRYGLPKHYAEAAELGERRRQDRVRAAKYRSSRDSDGENHVTRQTGVVVSSSTPSTSSQEKGSGDFDRFWQAFPKPRRQNKQDARKAWTALRPDAAIVEKILTALEAQKANPRLSKEDFHYFPHAHRWLRKRRWEDELPEDDNPYRDWPTLYDCAKCGEAHETKACPKASP